MQKGSVVMFMDGLYPYGPFPNDVSMTHATYPGFFPKARTIGTVICTKTKPMYRNNTALVQWPSGSTSEDDRWWCPMELLIELSHSN